MAETSKSSQRDATVAERRRFQRRTVAEQELVSVRVGETRHGLLLNLSEGGLALESFTPLETGQAAEIGFRLPGADEADAFRAMGNVVWITSSGQAGVEFTDLPPESAAALEQWLQGKERQPGLRLVVERPSDQGLAEICAQLQNGKLSLAATLDLLARSALEGTRASGAAIAVRGALGFSCLASSGLAPEVGVCLQEETGLSGQCISSGEIVLCEDAERDPRISAEAARSLQLRSAVILPMKSGEAVTGVLEVFSDEARHFRLPDFKLLKELAGLVASETARRTQIAGSETPTKAAAAEAKAAELLSKWRKEDRHASRLRMIVGSAIILLVIALGLAVRYQVWHRRPLAPPPRVPIRAIPAAQVQPAAAAIPDWPTSELPQPAAAVATPAVPRSRSNPPTPAVIPLRRNDKRPPQAGDVPPPLAEVTGASPGSGSIQTIVAPVALPALAANGDPLRVSEVEEGRVITRVAPIYPASMRGVGGKVVIKATVTKDGSVQAPKVVGGDRSLLANAALQAVRQWRYEPYRLDGQAVEVEVLIIVNFKAPNE